MEEKPKAIAATILDDYVWADSAYSGVWFRDLLSLDRFEYRSMKRSQIRARVETVFGCFATSMGAKFTRKLGLETIMAWWYQKSCF